jgi:microcystin degradation protein MlrC
VHLAIGAISHETNTFSKVPTTIESFEQYRYAEGEDIIATFRDTETAIGGFIDGAGERGITLGPALAAYALPSGIVSGDALRTLTDRLCDRLAGIRDQIDGLLLNLHGAMVSDIAVSGDTYILQRVRDLLGRDFPIGVVFDSHANLTPEMVNLPTILTGYDGDPHIDMHERGSEAVELLQATIEGSTHPVRVLRKLPILVPLPGQYRGRPIMRDLLAMAHEMEAETGVLNVMIAGGFPFADVPQTGLGIVVTTDGDQLQADELAGRLAALAWNRRHEFLVQAANIEEAVHHAMSAARGPVVLADLGDSPGAGAPGDGTGLLWALLDLGARNAALALITDPDAVEQIARAGVGEQVRIDLGGKIDRRHGYPVEVEARVERITDGRYHRGGPVGGGLEVDLGRTAVISARGRHEGTTEIIVCERRAEPDNLALFRSLGIEPTRKRMIVVKSNVQFRAVFDAIASEVIEVATPGVTTPDFGFFAFQHVHRPIFPLDEI